MLSTGVLNAICTVTEYTQKGARALIFLVMGLNQALKQVPKWDRAFNNMRCHTDITMTFF